MVDPVTLQAMATWVGIENLGGYAGATPEHVLWHVAERLEREGWWFGYPVAYQGNDRVWYSTKHGAIGPFPTKSAAVIAAWKHETGAKPDA